MQIPGCIRDERCENCSNHFSELRANVKEIEETKHFERDLKDAEERKELIDKIMNCNNEYFHELHKFEMSVDGNKVFRAKRDGLHILYSISGNKLTFLRAFKNFAEYKKFLDSGIEKIFN